MRQASWVIGAITLFVCAFVIAPLIYDTTGLNIDILSIGCWVVALAATLTTEAILGRTR